MKYAIVESGGKQYKAVEGETIEVDRLPVNAGDKVNLERVLMLVEGDDVAVGTPTVSSTQVSTTVVDHFKGPKIIVFKYSPRKRIRVKSGHRQQYTRLMVNTIGKSSKTATANRMLFFIIVSFLWHFDKQSLGYFQLYPNHRFLLKNGHFFQV